MAKPRIKYNLSAFREIRTSAAAQSLVYERAQAVAAAAGEGYTAFSHTPRNRAHATVVTTSWRAMLDNSRNQTLIKSMGAGGL